MLLAAGFAAGCRRPPPAPPEPPAANGRTLTVAFWNLDWFPGQHPHAKPSAQAAHVAAVVPVAERLDADVLGLEEIAGRDAANLVVGHLKGFKVDVCSEFLRGPEQKRKRTASREAGDEPGPDETPPADDLAPWTVPDAQQVALCSRLPALATGAEPWKPDPAGRRQRRGFVFAVYRSAPGEVLLVYGLHLKSNVADEPGGRPTNLLLREEASRQLLAHERATADAWARTDRLRLVVVGGDLNTSLDEAQFAAETTPARLARGGRAAVGLGRRPPAPPVDPAGKRALPGDLFRPRFLPGRRRCGEAVVDGNRNERPPGQRPSAGDRAVRVVRGEPQAGLPGQGGRVLRGISPFPVVKWSDCFLKSFRA